MAKNKRVRIENEMFVRLYNSSPSLDKVVEKLQKEVSPTITRKNVWIKAAYLRTKGMKELKKFPKTGGGRKIDIAALDALAKKHLVEAK